MVKRIGNIESFAIEYEVDKLHIENGVKWLFGKSRLIIDHNILGSWNDINHLGVLVAQLKGIIKLAPSHHKFGGYTKKKLLDVTKDPDQYIRNNLKLIHLAENFDDFLVLVHKDVSEITFVWRLLTDSYEGVMAATVNYHSFRESVNQFEIEYKKEIYGRSQ